MEAQTAATMHLVASQHGSKQQTIDSHPISQDKATQYEIFKRLPLSDATKLRLIDSLKEENGLQKIRREYSDEYFEPETNLPKAFSHNKQPVRRSRRINSNRQKPY